MAIYNVPGGRLPGSSITILVITRFTPRKF